MVLISLMIATCIAQIGGPFKFVTLWVNQTLTLRWAHGNVIRGLQFVVLVRAVSLYLLFSLMQKAEMEWDKKNKVGLLVGPIIDTIIFKCLSLFHSKWPKQQESVAAALSLHYK